MTENNNIVIYQSEDGKVHLDVVYNEEKKLSKQTKNSDVNIFAQNIFPKVFEKIVQNCYVQQMDAFAKLFEERRNTEVQLLLNKNATKQGICSSIKSFFGKADKHKTDRRRARVSAPFQEML